MSLSGIFLHLCYYTSKGCILALGRRLSGRSFAAGVHLYSSPFAGGDSHGNWAFWGVESIELLGAMQLAQGRMRFVRSVSAFGRRGEGSNHGRQRRGS